MEQLLLEVRPKFVECVAAETAEESDPGSNRRVARSVVARSAPGVRKEIAARDSYKAGVGGYNFTVAVLRHESHLGRVPQPMAEGRPRVAGVTRILTPDSA